MPLDKPVLQYITNEEMRRINKVFKKKIELYVLYIEALEVSGYSKNNVNPPLKTKEYYEKIIENHKSYKTNDRTSEKYKYYCQCVRLGYFIENPDIPQYPEKNLAYWKTYAEMLNSIKSVRELAFKTCEMLHLEHIYTSPPNGDAGAYIFAPDYVQKPPKFTRKLGLKDVSINLNNSTPVFKNDKEMSNKPYKKPGFIDVRYL